MPLTVLGMRNPAYADLDGIAIDLEVEFAGLGWVPFTARPDDVEEHGRLIHAAVMDGEVGEIAPYVPPEGDEP